MQKLRSNPLPKSVTEFRSLGNTLSSSFNCRAAFLSQMHGYPKPVNVLAGIWRYLDLSSVSALKNGIKKLRDIAHFASEVLFTIKLMRVERYQLQLGEMYEYVEQHAAEYGYKDWSKTDLEFAYLIVSAEVQENAWLLDLEPDSSSNQFSRFLKLYQSLSAPSISDSLLYDEATSSLAPSPEALSRESIYYVPGTDSFEPITQIVFPRGSLEAVSAGISSRSNPDDRNEEINALKEQVSQEMTLYKLADIRFVDHVLMLLSLIHI